MLSTRCSRRLISRCFASTSAPPIFTSEENAAASVVGTTSASARLKRIGQAMESYLKNAATHQQMMDRERREFEKGKRHLANIMGLDAAEMTQTDIDLAIQYLFPSALFDLKARPVMKPPDEILPKFKRIEFDSEARPKNFRFFTLYPAFYALLSEVGAWTHKVNRTHYATAAQADQNSTDRALLPVNLAGTTWLTRKEFEEKLEEKLTDEIFAQLMIAFDYLISLKGSALASDFIMGFRKPLTSSTSNRLFGPPVPTVEIDAVTGHRFAEATARVKATTATGRVTDAGSGLISINGLGLEDVRHLVAREIILSPLLLCDELGKVDVTVTTQGPGGETAVPRAIRHVISLGLAALRPQHAERLRLAGLLTRDPRVKERSKVNQPGARAKWIWKRR